MVMLGAPSSQQHVPLIVCTSIANFTMFAFNLCYIQVLPEGHDGARLEVGLRCEAPHLGER